MFFLVNTLPSPPRHASGVMRMRRSLSVASADGKLNLRACALLHIP
jgi:hypothetical protein